MMDTWLVLIFQVFWMVVILLLVLQLIKKQAIIGELRIALAPFARLYESNKNEAVEDQDLLAVQTFRIAWEAYTNKTNR